ncbi:Hypp3317 [Branchiostoma lanceolatum]|uniref:Hypp3317 protein n=1 Tax=Branchiostoma lanceolatum TaxID=7740 RepID=A0A8J9ZZ22_BRALA|nr:Hypp3317 [Branchiostoma lanceolatum]
MAASWSELMLSKLVGRCNNFFQPGSSRAMCKPFLVDGQQVGWVWPDVEKYIQTFPDVFMVEDKQVSLCPSLQTYEERTARVQEVMVRLREEGDFIALKGWRDEMYEVFHQRSSPPVFRMERTATALLGVKQYGVHVNGYVEHPQKGRLMWIGRRAKNKSTYPGKLDQVTAGGFTAGLTAQEVLVKECAEEANIPQDIALTAQPAGSISTAEVQHSLLGLSVQHSTACCGCQVSTAKVQYSLLGLSVQHSTACCGCQVSTAEVQHSLLGLSVQYSTACWGYQVSIAGYSIACWVYQVSTAGYSTAEVQHSRGTAQQTYSTACWVYQFSIAQPAVAVRSVQQRYSTACWVYQFSIAQPAVAVRSVQQRYSTACWVYQFSIAQPVGAIRSVQQRYSTACCGCQVSTAEVQHSLLGVSGQYSRGTAQPAEAISYFYEDERGLFPEIQFVFDLKLPLDFQPVNTDGEVSEFYLWDMDKVKEQIAQPDFKPNCAMVVLDFLIRHGHIHPDKEPRYLQFLDNLHKTLF